MALEIRIEDGHWVATDGVSSLDLTGQTSATIGATTYLLVDQFGVGTGGYQSVQAAIEGASGGETILIAPGTYTESGDDGVGHVVGLYINKPDLTLQGVDADGVPITTGADAKADGPTIIAGHQTGFGANHWIDVDGDGTVMQGLHLQAGAETTNKLLEIWADDVTVQNNFIDVYEGGVTYTYAVAIYLNDNGTTSSEISSYTISGNILNEGIIIANGVGDGDAHVPGATQLITNNHFEGEFSGVTGLGRYYTVVVNGQVNGVAWLLEPSQTPTISGNTFANNSTPFILRGSDDDEANLPTAGQIQAILDTNGDANLTYAYVVDTDTGALVTALRNDGGADYHSFAVTNSIDTLNLALDTETYFDVGTTDQVFPDQRIYIHDGDTIIVQSAGGAVDSQIMVDNLTVRATANSADLDLTLATTLADGTPIAAGGVHNVTLGDYTPNTGASVDVTGNGLANTITGNSGVNTLSGAGGNDTLAGGRGADTLDGGDDTDTAVYAGTLTLADITFNGTTHNWEVDGGDEGTDTLVAMEKVTDGGGSGQTYLLVDEFGSYTTIQAAINAASDGDIIVVAAGTYREQIVINGKDISIVGAGEGQTIIESPDSGDLVFTVNDTSSGRPYKYAIVTLDNDASLAISGVTIDGRDEGQITPPTNGDFVGIYARNSSLDAEDVTVTGIRDVIVGGPNDGQPSGVQRTHAVIAVNYDSQARTFEMSDSTVQNFQKNGFVLFGNGLTINLFDNEIHGAGPISSTAQNGIQVSGGATGTIHHNVIDGFAYSPASVGAVAILVFDAEGLVVTDNTVTGGTSAGDYGIYLAGANNATVTGNTLNDLDYAIILDGVDGPPDISTNVFGDTVANGVNVGFYPTSPAIFTGSAGLDELYGSTGNDALTGSGGADFIDGDTGTDTAVYSGTLTEADLTPVADADPFTAGDQPGWQVAGGADGTDTLVNVEIVEHAGGRFMLVGSGGFADASTAAGAATESGDVIVYAEPPVDSTIDQSGSTSDLNVNLPGSTNNNVQTGSGDDTVQTGSGNDTVKTGNGNDVVKTNAGDDTIIGGSGNGDDVYDGGPNDDTVSYTSATNSITVALNATDRSSESVSGADGDGGEPDTIGELLSAASYDPDTAVGKAEGDDIGTDALISVENVIAGQGNDSITGNSGDNRLDGHNGTDTVHYSEALTGANFEYDDVNDVWTLTTASSGTDTLVNIEKVDHTGPGNILLVGGGGYASIGAAIGAAEDGDTIIVAPGTWTLPGGDSGKQLTFLGANAGASANDINGDLNAARVAETVIDGSGTDNFRFSSHGLVTFDGFTFTGQHFDAYETGTDIAFHNNVITDPGSGQVLFAANSDTVTFQDNRITDVEAGAFDLVQLSGNWDGDSGTTIDISGNVVTDSPEISGFNLSNVTGTIAGNTIDGISYYGFLLANDTDVDVTGNTFANIANPDPSVPTWGAGIRTFTPGPEFGLNLDGNTFTDNAVGLGIRVGSDIDPAAITIVNNVFSGNGNAIVNQGITTTDVVLAGSNTVNGVLVSTATDAQLFAIADDVVDAVDNGSYGSVVLKDGYVYVTPDSFLTPGTTTASLQRAIDAAEAGDTVLVAEGTYIGNVTLKDGVSLVGVGDEADIVIIGTVITPATFGNALISNFTVESASASSMLLDMRGSTAFTDVIFDSITFSLEHDFVGEIPIGNGQISGSINLIDGVDADSAGLTFRHVTMASNDHEFPGATAFVFTIVHSTTGAKMVLDDVTLTGIAGEGTTGDLGAQWNMTPNTGETASVEIINSHTSGGGNFYVSGFDGVLIQNNEFQHQGLALNGVTDATVTGNTFKDIGNSITANGVDGSQHRGLVIEDAWGTDGVSGVTVTGNTFQDITATDGAIAIQRFTSPPSDLATIDRLNDVLIHDNDFTGVASPVFVNSTYFGAGAVLPADFDGSQLTIGTSGNDTLVDASTGEMAIFADAGDDSITGGAGADFIDGGSGEDTAVYAADLDAGDFSYDALTNEWTVVTGGAEGTDRLTGIEKVTDGNGETFLLVDELGSYTTIQAAVDAASAGDTILVAAGTFVGANIDKALTLIGAGVGETIITSAGSTGFQLQGDIDATMGGSATVTIQGFSFEGNTVGVRVSSGAILDHLVVDQSDFTGNTVNGVGMGSGAPGLGAIDITNSSFHQNGDGTENGDGDISLFGFTGDALIQHVTVEGAAIVDGDAAHIAIQVAGHDPDSYDVGHPIGTVTFDDVTVTGAYQQVLLYVQGYTDLDGLGFTDTTLDGSAGWGFGFFADPAANATTAATPDDPGLPGFFDLGASDGTSDLDLTGLTVVNDVPVNGTFFPTLAAFDGVPLQALVNGSIIADSITGTEGMDILAGNAGADTLNGAGGGDFLAGGVGDDELNGGSGDDAAIFADDLAPGDIVYDEDNDVWVATTATEGTDTLTGIGTVIDGLGQKILLANVGVAVDHNLVEATDTGPGVASATATITKSSPDGEPDYDTSTLAGSGWSDAGGGLFTKVGTYGTATLDTGADTVSYALDNVDADSLNTVDHPVENFDVALINDLGGKLTFTVSFTVDGANDKPGTPADSDTGTANSVAEGAATDTYVGLTALALDADNASVTYSLTDTAGGRFKINATTGAVSVDNGALLDYETDTSHTITVQASDGSKTSTETFTINVADVGPALVGSLGPVAEGNTLVGNVAAPGDDSGVFYAILGGFEDGALFEIDANGNLSFINAPDFETPLDGGPNNVYRVKVVASDDANIVFQTYDITVTDVAPSVPVDANAGANTVAEDALNGATVGVTASAADGAGGITYSLTEDAGGRFTINASTGVVTVANATLLDFEDDTSHLITVQADDGTTTSTQDFTIAVSNVAPSDPVDSNGATGGSVAENAANGTLVGITATSTDPHGGDVTYSLTDDAGGRFAIDEDTGVVTVANAALLNHEAAASHNITVKARDDSGLFNEETFAIAVSNVAPSTPTDTNGATNTIAEDVTDGALVGITASSTDPHGGTITYSLTNNAGGRFTINPTTGVVSVLSSALINFEGASSHGITVQASDGSGGLTTEDFTIAVTNVAPSTPTDSNGATGGSIAENSASDAEVGITALASDPHGGTITYSLTDNAGGRFTIDSGTGVIKVANGTLLDFESATSHNVTVQASDSNGGLSSQVFTIAITDVGGNTINGGGSNDTIDGTHTVPGVGPSGFATPENDTIRGGGGHDTISSLAGNDFVLGGAGPDTLNGGDGTDTVSYAGSNLGVRVNLALATAQRNGHAQGDLLSNFENLNGSSHNDTLTGNGGANTIRGGAGNDSINGGGGGDSLFGQAGNDTLRGRAGNDMLNGGAGKDNFVFATGYDADTVVGYAGGIDDFDLRGTSIVNYNQLKTLMTNTVAGVVIDFGGGDTLTITGKTIAYLNSHQADFHF